LSEWDRFVGIPYADRGRAFNGADCYGILFLAFREMLRIDLPALHDLYTLPADRKAIAGLIANQIEPWREVQAGSERTFDGVLMREDGQPRHIGVVTEPGKVCHVERGASSVIERYRSGHLQHRVIGFYRYRDHE
jgi:cell wall-associated NlpC family hydrolase